MYKYVCVCAHTRMCAHMCSIMSNSLRPLRLQINRLLCSWNFAGKNTGTGSHFLLQGIFLTQGLNTGLLHIQADSLLFELRGEPKCALVACKSPALKPRTSTRKLSIKPDDQNIEPAPANFHKSEGQSSTLHHHSILALCI